MSPSGKWTKPLLGFALKAFSVVWVAIRLAKQLTKRRAGGAAPTASPALVVTGPTGPGRAAVRFVIAVLVCVLIGSAATRYVLRRSGPLPVPVISPVPAEVGDPVLYLSGAAAPRLEVVISVSGLSDDKVTADEEGHFRAVFILPKGGDYSITARSEDGSGRKSPASEPLTVKYTPGREPPARVRKVTAFVSYRSVRFEVEEVAAKKDEASNLIRLLTGERLLSEEGLPPAEPTFDNFLSREFDGFTFQGQKIGSWMAGATPQFSIAEKTVTVRASSRPLSNLSFLSFRGFLNEELTVSLPQKAEHDNYVFIVNDYDVVSVKPLPPASINNSVRSWSVKGAQPRASQQVAAGDAAAIESPPQAPPAGPSQITLRLTYRPLASPENLLKLSHVTALELLSNLVTRSKELLKDLTRLLASLLLTLPIIWALCLSERGARGEVAGGLFGKRFNLAALSLLAACFVTPLLYLSQDDLYFKKSQLNDLLQYLFTSVSSATLDLIDGVCKGLVFACAASALYLAARLLESLRRRKDIFSCGLRKLSVGLMLASAATATIYVVAYLFRGVYPRGHDEKFAALVNAPVLLFLLVVVSLAAPPSRRRALLTAAVLVASFLAIFPFVSFPLAGGIGALLYVTRLFFATLQGVAPYLLFVLLLPVLKSPPRSVESDRAILLALAALIFASYVVGATPNWLLIPIPFMLALWVFPKMVAKPREVWAQTDEAAGAVFAQRGEQILRLISSPAQRGVNARNALETKWTGGEITREEYDKRRLELEEYIAAEADKDVLPNGAAWSEMALNFGPHESNWENAKWGAKHGLILAAPFFFFFIWGIFQREVGTDKPYLLFFLLTRSLIFFADWGIAAFFFGYFFPYLWGESGLKKGSYVGAAATFCLLSVWVFAPTSSPALILRAGQTFLFFAVLGVWAFDYSTLREELGANFDWKKLIQMEDLPSLTALASVAIGSLGVTINSVLTGQFQTVFTQVVKIVFQQLPVLEGIEAASR